MTLSSLPLINKEGLVCTFPPINLALKMLNCFCSNFKEEFGAIRRNSHQAFSLHGLLRFFKVKEWFQGK